MHTHTRHECMTSPLSDPASQAALIGSWAYVGAGAAEDLVMIKRKGYIVDGALPEKIWNGECYPLSDKGIKVRGVRKTPADADA